MHALLIPLLAIQVGTSGTPSTPEPVREPPGEVIADSAAMSSRPTLRAGARVRIFSPGLGAAPMVGRATALTGDTLTLEPDLDPNTTVRVRLDDRTRVDLSTAQTNLMGRGALIGGAVGLGIGGMIVLIDQTGRAAETIGNIYVGEKPEEEEVSQAPIYIGLAAGAAVGALFGAGRTVDKWVPVQVPRAVAFRVSSDGGRGLRLAVILR